MDKYIFDERNGLWYELQDNYYIPCLTVSDIKQYHISICGQKHKIWLKENRKVRYCILITSSKLNSYLHNIDLLASEAEIRLINKFTRKQGIIEELKANDMMVWISTMNNIKKSLTNKFKFNYSVISKLDLRLSYYIICVSNN